MELLLQTMGFAFFSNPPTFCFYKFTEPQIYHQKWHFGIFIVKKNLLVRMSILSLIYLLSIIISSLCCELKVGLTENVQIFIS